MANLAHCSTESLMPLAQAQTVADRIITQADAGCFPLPATVLSKLQNGDFELGGLAFKFKQEVADAQSRLLFCTAHIGYLPYTAEQRERRSALKTILHAAQILQNARFHVDKNNKIHLDTKINLPPHHEDEDIILALMAFYQEARPFLRLIATQL